MVKNYNRVMINFESNVLITTNVGEEFTLRFKECKLKKF